MKSRGEAERHLACRKTICVSTSVGTQKRYACGPAWAYVSLWEAEYDFVHTVVYLCAHHGLYVWVCALFPQAVTCAAAAAAAAMVSYSFCVILCVCVHVCVSVCVFKLLFNFYFLFYSWPNPNATQLCSQPEKEGLGDGLPGPGECSHALQLLPTDGREMGLPAWAYPLFLGQTDPLPSPHQHHHHHTHTHTHPPPHLVIILALKSLYFGVSFFSFSL